MLALSFAFLAAALASSVSADSLVTRRHLNKRFIDGQGNLNLSIIHTNDIHAHLDEFRSGGNDCRDTDTSCYGGYARIKTKVDEVKKTKGTNSTMVLDVPGDQFQGTMFYTYYKGEKIAETINQIGYDAGTLGNHEFDGGEEPLADYIANLTFPMICANVNTQNKRLSDKLVPYKIFPQWDVAVVAVLTPETKGIANPAESTTFGDPVEVMQKTVDEIRSTTNITRIIALTHIGYEEDIALAKKTKGLSLIIGAHSHTPLGKINGTTSLGDYPTIANNLDGEEVFVVTAWRWGEVLGHIEVAWDAAGKIVSYEGAPIPLNTNTTKQDTKLDAQIQTWKEPFAEYIAAVLGETKTDLVQSSCRESECTMGNLMSDAIVAYRNNGTTNVDAAIINAGGIRAGIDAGKITRGDAITVFPFGNAVVDLEFTGAELITLFERIASGQTTTMGQISKEIRYTFNPSNANNTRLITLEIKGAAVDAAKTYKISTLDFMATGGDNFFKKPAAAVLDKQDDVLTAYIVQHTPLNVVLDGRIATTTETKPLSSSGSTGQTTGGSGALEKSVPMFLAAVTTVTAAALLL